MARIQIVSLIFVFFTNEKFPNDELTFNSKISLIVLHIEMIICLALSITLASLTYFQIKRTKTLLLSDKSMQIMLFVVASVQVSYSFKKHIFI